jgi:hypothetical protein
MGQISLFWILLLSHLSVTVLSYSRQHRSFYLPLHIDSNDHKTHEYLSYDPLFDSLDDLLQVICSKRVCENKIELHLQLKHQYEQQLNEKIHKQLLSRHSIDRSGWLPQSDALTQLHYDQNTIQLQISLGNLLERKNLQATQKYLFQQLGYQFSPNFAPTVFAPADTGSSLIQFTSTEEFLNIARILFTKENYFLCFHLCDILYQFYFHQDDISYSDLRSLLLFNQMMILSSTFFGNLELSTLMTLKFLQIYGFYEIVPRAHWHFQSSLEGILAIHRLRLILLLPPLPQADHTSSSSSSSSSLLQHRQEMEQDLEIFIQDLLQRNITISLQDISVDSSSTPFHLSHQGLNDKNIQILLSSAYTTLCPSLNYISPRLTHFSSSSPAGTSPRTLRIGFISSHFYDHSIGRIFSELFLILNTIEILVEPVREEEIYLDFKVFFIDQSLEYGDDWRFPTSKRYDSISGRLFEALGKERFIFLPNDIELIREVVGSSEFNLDALIFADIGMDLTSYLLAHSRLAPYQVGTQSPLPPSLPSHSLLPCPVDRMVGSSCHLWYSLN